MKRTQSFVLAAVVMVGCSSPPAEPSLLSREQMLDPKTCENCHLSHFTDWSGSMHAYASDDPVFVAMNKRGQADTGGALGDFCLKCHAPMAVRMGMTEGGNVDTTALPASLKGVTCFFCHSTDATGPDHFNNSLHDSGDLVMRGDFDRPVPNGAHQSAYSPLHDGSKLESSAFCGSCHDIVTPGGAHVERTYEEWLGSSFSQQPPAGGPDSCAGCHMPSVRGKTPVDGQGAAGLALAARPFYSHAFPGVDVALTDDFPQKAEQRQGVDDLLRRLLQGALCVEQRGASFSLTIYLDNAGVGHLFPSGAVQDRRAWVELVAYQGDKVIYHSGTDADGAPLAPDARVVDLADPDLWLIRDCVFDDQGKPTHQFWQASSSPTPPDSNQLPANLTQIRGQLDFYKTHRSRTYPSPSSQPIAGRPDRVTMRVLIQPIGADVIDDLGPELKQAVGGRLPILSVLGPPGTAKPRQLEWTPAAAMDLSTDPGHPSTCVAAGYSLGSDSFPAPTHTTAACSP